MLRTTVPAADMNAAGVVQAYKNLAHLERDFRIMKADDLDLRPVRHWLPDRVKAHVLLCMLAAYLTWHLRAALAPLTYTDETPPARTNPVAPAQRSRTAQTKAARKTDNHNQPLHDFRGLLTHLATLTRNDIRYGHDGPLVPTLAEPTALQRHAFTLLGAPIPLHLNHK